METFIAAVILIVIIGLSGWYVYKSRKSGVKCIGCPDGATCGGNCSGCGGGCSGGCGNAETK